MMEAAVLASASPMTVGGGTRLCCSIRGHRRISSVEKNKIKKKALGTVKFVTVFSKLPSSPSQQSSSRIPVATREPEEPNSIDDNNASGIQDLKYLAKIGAGSVAAAAVIKYGSILFPEITRPNITQALFMILVPTFIAVLLLIRQSYAKQQS